MPLHDDIPEAEYHADRDSLSVTGAKVLIKSPAKFRWQQNNPVHKDAFDFGHAAHAKVLGVGAEIVAIDVDSKRGKAWTEPAEAARADGRIPLLRKEADAVDAMSEAVLAGKARPLFEGEGANEQTIRWDEEDVQCRARLDRLTPHGIVDLKTTIDASPSGFGRSAANYRYDLQHATYVRGIEATTNERLPFIFVAVEKTEPYPVALYVLPPDAIDRGDRSRIDALDIYRRCRDTNQWPDYPTDITELTWPRWAS